MVGNEYTEISNEYEQESNQTTEYCSEVYGLKMTTSISQNRQRHSDNLMESNKYLFGLLSIMPKNTYNYLYLIQNNFCPDLSLIIVKTQNAIEFRFDTFGSVQSKWKHIAIVVPLNPYIKDYNFHAFDVTEKTSLRIGDLEYNIRIINEKPRLVIKKRDTQQYIVIRNKKIIFVNQFSHEFIYYIWNDEDIKHLTNDEDINYVTISIDKLEKWFTLSYQLSGRLQFCSFTNIIKCNKTGKTKEILCDTPGKQIFYSLVYNFPIPKGQQRGGLCGF